MESYIQSENLTRTLYRCLASKCHGQAAAMLRRMSGDETRHLKSMQLEYYLLTGDTMPLEAPVINGTLQDNLRLAYAGEWGAASDYAAEAQRHGDARLKALYLAQSRDELRHRRLAREIVSRLFGG